MKIIILRLIKFYQKLNFLKKPIFKSLYLSEASCRFVPTCSEYTYQAISKYGIIKGSYLGLQRIVKCNPWNKGGQDKLK